MEQVPPPASRRVSPKGGAWGSAPENGSRGWPLAGLGAAPRGLRTWRPPMHWPFRFPNGLFSRKNILSGNYSVAPVWG